MTASARHGGDDGEHRVKFVTVESDAAGSYSAIRASTCGRTNVTTRSAGSSLRVGSWIGAHLSSSSTRRNSRPLCS